MFAYTLAAATRKLTFQRPTPLKIYCAIPTATVCTLYFFGPVGGFGAHTRAVVNEKVRESGKSFEEVCGDVLCNISENVIDMPGMPKMFDYEHYPQKVYISQLVARHTERDQKFM